MVELLIKKGANVNAVNEIKLSPLLVAVDKGTLADIVIQWLRSQQTSLRPVLTFKILEELSVQSICSICE